MKYGEWILQCLGVYDDGKYLDDIAESFGVEVDETEDAMLDDIELVFDHSSYARKAMSRPKLGNLIASRLFAAVIERAEEELDAEDEDFDYFCNGTLDTWITCKGEAVTSWEEIEKLYPQNDEEDGKDN